jgi:hypothetical protein
MKTRLYCFIICSVTILTGLCFSRSVSVSPDQKSPVLSNAPCMLTLTWSGGAGEHIPAGLVSIIFTDCQNETVYQDIHYPPADLKPDYTRDWSAAYTVPVFIPCQTAPATWSVSITADDIDYTDIARLDIEQTSVFQNIIAPLPVFGWRKTESDAMEKHGFHNRECGDSPTDCWIWMTESARIEIPNPLTDFVLKLAGWIPDHLNPGLELHVAGQPVDSGDSADNHFDVTQNVSFDSIEDRIVVTIETAESYIPADDGISADTRELGMMIRTFQIIPADDMFDDRPMFDLLYSIDPERSVWRMGDASRLRVPNPGRDFQIFMKCRIPDGFFIPGVQLRMFLNGIPASSIVPPGKVFALDYQITSEAVTGSSVVDVDIVIEYPFMLSMPGLLFRAPGMIVSQLWIN